MAKYEFSRDGDLSPGINPIGNPSISSSGSVGFSGWNGNPKSSLYIDDGNYIEISLSTTGYENIKVEWDGYKREYGTGQLRLRADSGDGYGSVLETQNCPIGTWASASQSLSSDFDNNSIVKIRIYSNVNGYDYDYVYLDNLLIKGTLIGSDSDPCTPVVGTTPIWEEDFEGINQGWTAESPMIVIARSGNKVLAGSDLGDVKEWVTDEIDISAFTDLKCSIGLGSWRNKLDNTDYIAVYYSLNGVDFTEFSENGYNIDDIGTITSCTNIPEGNKLVFKVIMRNNHWKENYYIDNVVVTGIFNVSVPVISDFTPKEACDGSSKEITINGTNFTAASTVTFFDGVNATPITFINDTQIKVKLPTGAITGPITVTNADGSGASNTDFTVNSVPSSVGTITGNAVVLTGESNVQYYCPEINATSYIWSYEPSDGVTINGSGKNISIDFAGSAKNGVLKVQGENSCGVGSELNSFPITVADACQFSVNNWTFNEPVLPSNKDWLVYPNVNGWSSSPHGIEIWKSGFTGGRPSYSVDFETPDGGQFCELNSNGANTMWQDIDVVAGAEMRWAVTYKYRSNSSESIRLRIGPIGNLSNIAVIKNNNGDGWVVHSGTYTVPNSLPSGQVRFQLSSISTGGSGNLIDGIQFYSVNSDSEPPVFESAPEAVTVESIGAVPAMTDLEWTDNCAGIGSVTGVDGDLVGTSCCGTITRTWSYSDASGNSATATQIITIEDKTLPTFTVPADITINSAANCTYDASVLVTGDVTDEAGNCGVEEATFVDVLDISDPCSKIITRTWSLVDNCGNDAMEQVQLIAIKDITPPSITAPPAVNVNIDADNCFASSVVLGIPVTDDNCSVALVVSDAPATFPLGETTVVWTVTDGAGLKATATQTVTVVDNTPPSFTNNLNNITKNTDPGKCTAIVTYNNPVVTDNCASIEDIPGYTYVGKFNGHSYYMSNSPLNAMEANKAAFNVGGHLITIETQAENDFVRDNSILKANVFEGVWIGLNDTLNQKDFKWVTGGASDFYNWNGSQPSDNSGTEDWVEFYVNWGSDKVGSHPENGKWNDNSVTTNKKYIVEFEGPRFIQTLGLPSGSAFPVGTTTNTFEIINSDGIGTGIVKSFDVTVIDDEAPTLDELSSMSRTVCADNDSEGNMPQTAVVTGLNLNTDLYSDNCTDDINLTVEYKVVLADNTVVFDFGERATDAESTSDPSGFKFPEGVNTIYFKVIDDTGKKSEEKSFTVTVNPKPKPIGIFFE